LFPHTPGIFSYSRLSLTNIIRHSPEVLVTHTKDLGHILSALHATSSKISGAIDIPTALSIAQLALKHRENKNLRQRIIVFVASPLEGQGADEKGMIKLAKKLKKNNVAVDVVAYGDGIEEGERGVLKAFVESASSGDNSYVDIPSTSLSWPIPSNSADIWYQYPRAHTCCLICSYPHPFWLATAAWGSQTKLWVMEVSVPDLQVEREGQVPDSSLAWILVWIQSWLWCVLCTSNVRGTFLFTKLISQWQALRMSMQEEQARQAAEGGHGSAAAAADSAPAASASTTTPAAPTTSVPAPPTESDEDALLAQALAMSEGKDVDMDGVGDAGDEDEEMDEEEAIRRAIEMSMKGDQEEKK
jgi:26S proteasome regulatory subunit N10